MYGTALGGVCLILFIPAIHTPTAVSLSQPHRMKKEWSTLNDKPRLGVYARLSSNTN